MHGRSAYAELFSALNVAGILTAAVIWFEVTTAGRPTLLSEAATVFLTHAAMLVFFAGFSLRELAQRSAGVAIGLLLQSLAALTVIALCRGGTGPVLLVIIAAQLPATFTLRQSIAILAVLNLVYLAVMILIWKQQLVLLSLTLYGGFQFFALISARYAVQAERARDELQTVNAELLATRRLLEQTARDRERLRVSRELHDVAGHTLTALKLNLRSQAESLDGEAAEVAHQSYQLADDLLADIRSLVGNLRQHESFLILPALEQLVAPFESPAFELNVAEELEIDNLAIVEILLGVAREAITNVVRHASASKCRIALQATDTGILLECADNGRGMGSATFGYGLKGMRERLSEVGGRLDIESSRAGTRLLVHLEDQP